MGKTCGKTIIIEFNGIPGSGKSTTMYEMKKKLKEIKIKEISPQRIIAQDVSYKEILFSKEIREAFIIFLRILLLVSPLTKERWRFMQLTFRYWCGVRKLGMEKPRQTEVCILEQGIIQGFVSIAYQGKIRDEEKYCRYIGRLMESLNYVLCINCNVDIETAKKRLKNRKLSGGRLYQIKSDKELEEILLHQKEQFEKIRKISIQNSFDIDMENNAEENAEKIVKYCVG